jgi:putative salt-induced outer membrane protein
MRTVRVLVLAAAWCVGAARLAAQQKDPAALTSDFGLVNTAGNASQTTVSASDKLELALGRWGVRQEFQLIYGRSDSATIASFYRALLRGEYDGSAPFAPFAYVQWDRNRLAGLARRLEEGAGLSYRAAATGRDTLAFELGATLVQQRFLAAADDDFAAARAALKYRHLFAAKTELFELLEYLPDLTAFGNFRVNSETSAVAPITRIFSLKASYIVRFNNRPPLALRRTDRFLTVGLQVRL